MSRLRQLLAGQQQELVKLAKLVEFTRPTQLPTLQPKSKASVMIGKRWGFGGSATSKNLRIIQPSAAKIFENSAEKAEIIEKSEAAFEVMSDIISDKSDIFQKMPPKIEPKSQLEQIEEQIQTATQTQIQDQIQEQIQAKDQKIEESDLEKSSKKKRKRRPKNQEINSDNNEADFDKKVPGDYDTSDPKYATWVPPTGQSGDGRTSLNEKFGY